MDEAILHAAFIPFGVVKEVTMPIDAGTGKRRGYGFVDFEEADDAAEARDNMNSTFHIKQYITYRCRVVWKSHSSGLF